MAGDSNAQGVTSKEKNPRPTIVQNGLNTPEGTPDVDDGRITAENARQAAEASDQQSTEKNGESARQAAEASEQENAEKSGGNASKTNDVPEDEEMEDEDKDDTDYEPAKDDDKEEEEARDRVMSCDPKDYRGILGVGLKETYKNKAEEKTAVLDAYRSLGSLIHPDFSKDERAEDAFDMVRKAAKKLGIEKKYLEEVEFWDGKTEFSKATFSEEMPKSNGETTHSGEPNTVIQGIYREAPPYLDKLFIDSADTSALAGLRALNKKIATQNKKDGVTPADHWTIDLGNLGSYYNQAKPLYERLLDNELDEEAKQRLENIRTDMAKSFPEIFIFPTPTAEARAKFQNAKAEAKRREEAEQQEKAKQQEKSAAKNSKFGNINFPWVTHLLPSGERIITGRQRSKDDVAGSLCVVELPCTDPNKPKFEFRDDIDIIQLTAYFKTPGIKLMGETDEEGRPVKVWRKADRAHFKRFLFCVVGKRKVSDSRKVVTPRCPEVLCGVEMDYGITTMNKTGLFNMVGTKPGTSYVRSYCEDMGLIAPWDVEPEAYIITKQQKAILDKTQVGSTPNGEATPSTTWTPINAPSGAAPPKNVRYISLQDLLDLESRWEQRMNTLESSTSKLAAAIDAIIAKLPVGSVS